MLLQAGPTPPPTIRCSPVRTGLDDVRLVTFSPDWMREWSALEERLQSTYLTCSREWTATWLKHYGDLVPHQIAVGRCGTEVVGLCLITKGVGQYNGPFTLKSLHIGTAGEPELDSVCVEYNRLLVAPERRADFIRQLTERITAQESYDSLMIDGMAEAESREFLAGAPPQKVREVPSYYCDLKQFRSATAEPWRLFGESTRTNLRRALRDLGKIEVDWAEDAPQAVDFYDEMIGYHQARWNAVGKPGAFASARFRNFHQELIEAWVPQQRATLVRMREGGRVLAILYLLIEQNRLWYYQGGLPDHQSKLSLGNVAQYSAMLEGARRGYDAFDFLAGEAQYKRSLSTHQNTIFWAEWRKPSLKSRLMDGLRSLRGQ